MLSRILSFGLILGVQFTAPLIAVAAELAEIQERGRLIVAVKDNWRPLGFRNTDGELTGLEIDLARRLAEELLGDPEAIVLKPVSNLERLSIVLEGRADLAIAGVTATGARSRLVSFSIPYYLDSTAILTRDRNIRQLADIGAQPIAVLEGSSAIAHLRHQFPTVNLIGVSSYEAARVALENHQAVAFAGDVTILTGWIQEYSDYHLLPTLLSVEPLAVVVPKGVQYSPLRRRINAAIAHWIEDGWLEERTTHWGLP
ncbi:MAG: transporter substrate-binding domain-containing protein [Pseudanabaenales cyanobacterium]|nr:transporter substrate-binding domain-containing protein [Pseudanabaenales cyanobacterium]